MVSNHRVLVDVLLIINIVCFIFRFKRGSAMPRLLVGGCRIPWNIDATKAVPRYMRETLSFL